MTDFNKIALNAKAKVIADKLADARQEVAAQKAEEDRLAAAQSFLVTDIQPYLEQAKAAFQEQGVGLDFKLSKSVNFERHTQAVWAITVSCHKIDSSVRVSSSRRVVGDTVRFEHNGSHLIVTNTWGSRYDNKFRGNPPEVIETAMTALIERYYEDDLP